MKRNLLVTALLVITCSMPAPSRGNEPMDVILKAFRASWSGLKSGIGTGKYGHYEAKPGEDGQLKIDADLRACFDGRKYRVDLKFERDMLGLDAGDGVEEERSGEPASRVVLARDQPARRDDRCER
ncbi:MAG: hypothetical protein ACP5XB_04130 [Isosphaeraceae bacterium]